MNIQKHATRLPRQLMLVALAAMPVTALADSGFYIGGSVGTAAVKVNLNDIPALPSSFDENDSAYKGFVGYRLDLPSTFLGVEASYVDFGAPDVSALGSNVALDTTGTNLWGIAGLEVGPLEFFGKLGYIAWDLNYVISEQGTTVSTKGRDDGTDLGYGLGVAFSVGPVYIRGEYEQYDMSQADLSMVSVGVSYLFD